MDDKDDIALMFEAELHNLDNYDGEEEYDESTSSWRLWASS